MKSLSQREAVYLRQQRSFDCDDATLVAILLLGEIEGGWLDRHVTALSKSVWLLFSAIMPPLVFVCRKPSV